MYRQTELALSRQFPILNRIFLLSLAAVSWFACAEAFSQRARFPDFFQVQTNPQVGVNNSTIINQPPVVVQPPPPVLNQPPASGATTSGNFAPPGVDPFQTPSQPFPVFPQPQQTSPQLIAPQPYQVQPFNQPSYGAQPVFGANPGYTQYPYGGTNSNWLPSWDWSQAQQSWRSFRNDFLPRLFERPRIRYTSMYGNNGNELGIDDVEFATTMTIPQFMQSTQPLRVTPGFIAHFWNGPDSDAHPGFDLPASAFSGFISADHLTNPANQIGLETNFTIGFYSDYENYSSDGLRLTGRLVGWTHVNSYTVAKFGVEYFDRVNVKLLPAFGVYMTPTPDLKLDLFFPRSKLSHRLPNYYDVEAWAYIGGEYGGGSWAIERADGSRDQADINDVRAFIGLEWMGPRGLTGFVEAGYVFQREIVYRSDASMSLELQDTVMIRSGLAF